MPWKSRRSSKHQPQRYDVRSTVTSRICQQHWSLPSHRMRPISLWKSQKQKVNVQILRRWRKIACMGTKSMKRLESTTAEKFWKGYGKKETKEQRNKDQRRSLVLTLIWKRNKSGCLWFSHWHSNVCVKRKSEIKRVSFNGQQSLNQTFPMWLFHRSLERRGKD